MAWMSRHCDARVSLELRTLAHAIASFLWDELQIRPYKKPMPSKLIDNAIYEIAM